MTPYIAIEQIDILILLAAVITAAIVFALWHNQKEQLCAETFAATSISYVKGVLELGRRLGSSFAFNKALDMSICEAVTDKNGNSGILLVDRYAHHYQSNTTFITFHYGNKNKKIDIKTTSFFPDDGDIVFITLAKDKELHSFLAGATCVEEPPKDQDHVYASICGKEFWFIKERQHDEEKSALLESVIMSLPVKENKTQS